MAKYASGKNAWGISDRSGFRYKLNRMRKEWTGALVGPEEWEPKHPQLEPRRRVIDPQALKDPRPDFKAALVVYVGVPLVELPQPAPIRGVSGVGTVTVVTS